MVKQKLYPLKFKPSYKERGWGGKKLSETYSRIENNSASNIGESWEIVCFVEESSIIANGFLEGNSLYEIMEIYMGDLVGEDNYKIYGNEFPLFVKLLDINDFISVQVHPDNETAFDRHNSYGKSEAWYILDADENARIYMGFNKDMTPTELYERCKNSTLEEVLNVYHPKKGDFFFVESGVVHSAKGGILVAEVQQLSDITYRIYDWGRENNPETARKMHLDLSIDSIMYERYDESKYYHPISGQGSKLIKNNLFSINKLQINNRVDINNESLNRFTIYLCIDGSIEIFQENGPKYQVEKGELILIPASYDDYSIMSSNNGNVLEIFVEE